MLQSEAFYHLSVSQSVSQSINKAHYLIWQWVDPAINEDCWLEALYPTQCWFFSQCCYLFSNLNASQLCWWESGKPKYKASLLAYMNGATWVLSARAKHRTHHHELKYLPGRKYLHLLHTKPDDYKSLRNLAKDERPHNPKNSVVSSSGEPNTL